MESKNCLPVVKILELLKSKSFENIVRLSSRTNLYKTDKGILYIRTSKDYGYTNKTFWYSINPNDVINNKVDYIVLVGGFDGYFIIPVSYILDYGKKYHVGCVKGGREDFTILRRSGRYFRNESKNSEDDITRFFISAS